MRGVDPRIVLGLYRARPTRRILEAALDLGVRHVDTAGSYHHGRGHLELAAAASDLLVDLTISTKVGFFLGGRHSLEPKALREAIERSCDDFGRPADLVFLHNPETTLEHQQAGRAETIFEHASAALVDAVTAGLCNSWGIASWNPGPVLDAVRGQRPDVLMIRSGLSAGARQLAVSEELVRVLAPCSVWGMSPFAGSAAHPVWREVNARQFLQPGQDCTDHQAVFRTAFALPEVDRVAVGTGDPGHLHELVAATEMDIDSKMIDRYRELLAVRSAAR